jgi:hypothetical protein
VKPGIHVGRCEGVGEWEGETGGEDAELFWMAVGARVAAVDETDSDLCKDPADGDLDASPPVEHPPRQPVVRSTTLASATF